MTLLALRAVLIAALTAAGGGAALLPEALGAYERGELRETPPPDADLFAEFGFEASETARYDAPTGAPVTITATRFYDDTGAFAAYRWLRPAQGEAVDHGRRAWKSPAGAVLIQLGNYLVEMSAEGPLDDHIELMLAYSFPRMRVTADPPVLAYVPTENIVAGSERHILGPEALKRLAPEVAPSTAGFHFGAEGYFARYDSPSGEQRFLMLSYPTPQMAREQIEKFRGTPDLIAKRSGPTIAAVIAPDSLDDAERLLARVRYEAEVTMDYTEPKRHDNWGYLLIDIFIMCGVLALLCVVGGVLVAGMRQMVGKYAPNSILAAPQDDGMTRLRIDEHP